MLANEGVEKLGFSNPDANTGGPLTLPKAVIVDSKLFWRIDLMVNFAFASKISFSTASTFKVRGLATAAAEGLDHENIEV